MSTRKSRWADKPPAAAAAAPPTPPVPAAGDVSEDPVAARARAQLIASRLSAAVSQSGDPSKVDLSSVLGKHTRPELPVGNGRTHRGFSDGPPPGVPPGGPPPSGLYGGGQDAFKRQRFDGGGGGGDGEKVIFIPHDKVGLVIGRGGETINSLQSSTGAQIQIAPADQPPQPTRQVTISGTPGAIQDAEAKIAEITAGGREGYGGGGGRPPRPGLGSQSFYDQMGSKIGEMKKRIDIPQNCVGLLIGKGGDTIRMLQQKTGAHIQVTKDAEADPSCTTRPVEISGSEQEVETAQREIQMLIQSSDNQRGDMGGRGGGMGGMGGGGGGGGGEKVIFVPNDCVGIVIGRGGETIKSLQNRTGSRIQISKDDRKPQREVTLIGGDIQYAEREIMDMVQQAQDRHNLASGRGGGGGGMGRPPMGGGYGGPPPGYGGPPPMGGMGNMMGGRPGMGGPSGYNPYGGPPPSSSGPPPSQAPDQQQAYQQYYNYYYAQQAAAQKATGGGGAPPSGPPPGSASQQAPAGGAPAATPPAGGYDQNYWNYYYQYYGMTPPAGGAVPTGSAPPPSGPPPAVAPPGYPQYQQAPPPSQPKAPGDD